MKRKMGTNLFKSLFLIMILFLGASNASAAQWEVGSDQVYTTIQSAIDNGNTLDDDVINVHSGTYTEDVIVNKKLTIQVNSGDEVQLQATNTGFSVVNDSTGDGSGSTIDGFNISNSASGTGINVSADNCTVKNNDINGGTTGIAVSGANTTLSDNVITGQSETGILGNLTGGFFTVTGNSISNIIGGGLANGITVSTNGSVTDFNISENTISKISAVGVNGSVFAIQLGKSKGADGNPEMANVTNLVVTKNIISQISATSAIMGMELISNSNNAIISDNDIYQLNTGTGGSVYALEAAIIGNGTVLVSKNQISKIYGEEQAAGIVTIALGYLKLENNLVSDISKAKATVAVLGLGLLNNATFENNSVSNITSPSTAAGIVGVSLGNLNMLHNTVMGVNGTNDVSMVTAGFNTTLVDGNNLEGDGSGIGIVICSPNGTINYNRIVNYDYYIQNFLFSNFGPNIDEMLKPIDDAMKKHPELEPILKPIRDDLDKMFHRLENSNTTATYNWYGTNSPAEDKFFKGNGTLNYTPWLVLNINASPSTINAGATSAITADVYHDSEGGDHSADAAMFFSGPQVTFTTDMGNLGSKSVVTSWINGFAMVILRAEEGPGIATVTAADYQIVQTAVTILGTQECSTSVNTANNTIGMQETGIPITTLLLAVFMVFSGMLLKRQ
ncbi:cell surface protein [uncultured Methanobacterium sp.]|uniref:cell surface protein n=1 Tax=uncultured Methanobacterium sp. TaxID=176306 RepID=UPI002AA67054|nr:cell surface protein [uncultured Methanobacterium sp.]